MNSFGSTICNSIPHFRSVSEKRRVVPPIVNVRGAVSDAPMGSEMHVQPAP